MIPSQKKLGMLAFLLIVTACFAIPAFAFQNEPDGFRGVKWGTNINELHDMVLYQEDGDTKAYQRNNDKIKIGDAEISLVVYGFYKGRFYAVHIGLNGDSNFKKLKNTFFDQFGQGYQSNRYMEDYDWMGANVAINFQYKEIGNRGRILFNFRPIREEKEADDEQKARKGAKDL